MDIGLKTASLQDEIIDQARRLAAAANFALRAEKAAQAAGATPTPPDDGPSLFEQIREVGFSAYADKIREENLKELREKILSSMGLSEEDLAKMSPEQRQATEDIVAREIRSRRAAQGELSGDKLNSKGGVPASLIASPDNLGGGMGLLIALQALDFKESSGDFKESGGDFREDPQRD